MTERIVAYELKKDPSPDQGDERILRMVQAIGAVLADPKINMRPVDRFDLERVKRQWQDRLALRLGGSTPERKR